MRFLICVLLKVSGCLKEFDAAGFIGLFKVIVSVKVISSCWAKPFKQIINANKKLPIDLYLQENLLNEDGKIAAARFIDNVNSLKCQ